MNKQIIRILSNISPTMVAGLAYRTLTNPQIKKLRKHELELLDKAQKKKIRFGEFDIQTYKWGNEANEKILLIHGWEGQAGNFTDIIHDFHIHLTSHCRVFFQKWIQGGGFVKFVDEISSRERKFLTQCINDGTTDIDVGV